MEQSVRRTFKKTVVLLAAVLLLHTGFAQGAPELIFRNPVLEAGTDKQDGAVYRFANITTGVDGLLKIKKRSEPAVELVDIDVANLGWEKALQPRLGISGRVQAGQTWWMEFELKFVKTGGTKKVKLDDFVATSIDVDGDNVSIREFVQMNKMKTMAYSSVSSLRNETVLPEDLVGAIDADDDGDDHSFNLAGIDKMILGPVANFVDIDTAATAVMATYTYENKDAITFVMGAQATYTLDNAGIAGQRLNSLWFKSFSLAPQYKILPVKLETFSATCTDKTVTLNWKTASEKDFSHFVVQRSLNRMAYSDVATVFGNGGSENRYSFKDKNVAMPSGVAYYRLLMVDEDGTGSYSALCTVHSKEDNNTSIAVSPNPATSHISVSLPGSWQGKPVQLNLSSISGAVHTSLKIKSAGGAADVPVSSLPMGIYIVEATCNGETAQQRIIKN